MSGVNKISGMLALVKCESLGDWWTIEHATHDNRKWLKPEYGGFSYMHSGRISDADVEGSSGDMENIAKAIEERSTDDNARRCAVRYVESDGGFLFWSPRNSQVEALVSVEAADDLARQIRAALPKDGAK